METGRTENRPALHERRYRGSRGELCASLGARANRRADREGGTQGRQDQGGHGKGAKDSEEGPAEGLIETSENESALAQRRFAWPRGSLFIVFPTIHRASMLRHLRRLGTPKTLGTSAAVLVGLASLVGSREMASVATRLAPTARLSDLAGAKLTKLPGKESFKASTLWHDKPAVVLVLRRPG